MASSGLGPAFGLAMVLEPAITVADRVAADEDADDVCAQSVFEFEHAQHARSEARPADVGASMGTSLMNLS